MKNQEASNAAGEVYDSTGATTDGPTRFQSEGAETSIDLLYQNQANYLRRVLTRF
ncbi:MAG: hypothetical protein GX075_02545 [Firmicutes bacterium]|nr:hypothetical protein [Bacillota bacterium]